MPDAVIVVHSCDKCNGAFSKHEDDFRAFCTLAGQDRPEVKELFYGPLQRALDRPNHGIGLLKRTYSKMKESVELPGRHKIYADENVFFIVRKIIRGLAFKHCGNIVLSDADVSAQVLTFEIPEEFNRDEVYHTIHPAMFRYQFEECSYGEHKSLWLLKILETVRFVGVVLRPSDSPGSGKL